MVIDAELEAGGTPFDEVKGGLSFEGGNGSVAVTGNDVTTVEKGDGHIFSVAGVADYHLVIRLEASVCGQSRFEKMEGDRSILQSQILGLEAFMAALCRADDGCVTNQWVMNPGVRNQVGLELVQIDV